MRIAIVGGGVSGLVCADLLRHEHDVRLFEAGTHAGGHANTVRVELPEGTFDVETGFVVYNERTYPLFSRLLADLGVATRATEMSFSVSCARTGLEYNGGSLGGLFAQRRNLLRPEFLGMIRDVLRFYREAPELLRLADAKVTLGEWLAGRGYGEAFVSRHLLPMGAAIWSCEPGQIRDFPALALFRFFANHGLLELRDRPQWRVVEGGSARYVDRLTARFRERIQLRERVLEVSRGPDAVELAFSSGARARFDRVVFATHSDQALACLRDATAAERAILSAIRYRPNDVVLHSDDSLLPRTRRARAAWNFHVPEGANDSATVSYDMARLQGLHAPIPLLVTLNRTESIEPARILKRFTYHHPVYDRAALEAQSERGSISGVNRSHYCGAYWGYGFHEDGVRSAHAVAAELAREG